MAKKRRVGRYPKSFRQMAVQRLKSCENIVALSEELGVHRRLLYEKIRKLGLDAADQPLEVENLNSSEDPE